MALIKEVELDSGHIASYWRIGTINIHPKSGAVIVMLGYKDEAARKEGKSPVKKEEIALSWAECGDCSMAAIYDAVKTGKLEGAVDHD